MSRPTILREALLDHQILSQLPGLASHLDDPTPTATTPTGARFLDDLRQQVADALRHNPHPAPATGTQEDPMTDTPHEEQLLLTNTDTNRQATHRQQQVEAEADQVRGRALLEEARRTEEAPRQAGYDSPVTERARPVTPRPPR